MKTEQAKWRGNSGWEPNPPGQLGESAQLVMLFGERRILANSQLMNEIRAAYPSAHVFGCSTAGEIQDVRVSSDSLALTAVSFEHTTVRVAAVDIADSKNSFQCGEQLAQSLDKNGLVHAFVLSDGLSVNGTELLRGITKHLPEGVTVTGGLSGDGDAFQETAVLCNGSSGPGRIAILGLYGDRLKVGYGSLGGWDAFGPERLVTKSSGNVLYEIDGKSALELYKNYLGSYAEGLPATGLLFPLSVRTPDGDSQIVRTILSVSEDNQSMTFAGDIPEGCYARLMKANVDHLVDGAIGAAKTSYDALGSQSPDLAVLISCVGRRLVLKQRIEEEVEAVRDVVGDATALTGFYSYGEICPFVPGGECALHNQTMTITTFLEL